MLNVLSDYVRYFYHETSKSLFFRHIHIHPPDPDYDPEEKALWLWNSHNKVTYFENKTETDS